MLLDNHFYWKSNDKNKDGFSAHILPFGHNNETFAKSSGEPTINNMDAKLIRGRLFTTERAMKMPKEDELLIVQNQENVHSSSKKNRNYARSHKIGMSKLVMKVMGNVSTGLHNKN